MSIGDFKLDALLRAVTPPSGLLERLMALPFADSAGLDEAVRDVEVPDGLLQRLAAIPLADDDGMDEALRDVPVPRKWESSFRRHMHRMAVRRRNRPANRALRISRIAMAMSLIVAVTLSLGSAFVFSWFINRSSEPAPDAQMARQPKRTAPVLKEPALETSWRMMADDDSSGGDSSGGGFSQNKDDTPSKLGSMGAQEMELVQLESAADRAKREALAAADMPVGADPLARAQVTNELGIHEDWDSLPELPIRPTGLIPHGLDWPLVREANRSFLIRYGVHPFVAPVAGSPLQTCAVPLAVETSSYELTRRYLEQNEMPPPNRVRIEDFLAAVDYGFPKPPGRELGLTVAGGKSPISGEEFSLLQVGVQAWQGDDTYHAPVHLVLLVDTSTSMRWGSRMEIVRRALGGLPDLLGRGDRLSLVTFNQAAHVLVEDISRETMSQFRAAANSLAAEGSTNFVGGLREAFSVARESLGPNRAMARIVLLTDGLLDLDPSTTEKIEKEIADVAQQKVRLSAIDLGQQQKEADPQLAAMSRAGQGSVHRAVSADEVRWALRNHHRPLAIGGPVGAVAGDLQPRGSSRIPNPWPRVRRVGRLVARSGGGRFPRRSVRQWAVRIAVEPRRSGRRGQDRAHVVYGRQRSDAKRQAVAQGGGDCASRPVRRIVGQLSAVVAAGCGGGLHGGSAAALAVHLPTASGNEHAGGMAPGP